MRKFIFYSLVSFFLYSSMTFLQAQEPKKETLLQIQKHQSEFKLVISDMSTKGTIIIYKAGGDIKTDSYTGNTYIIPRLPSGQNLILVKDSNGKMATITFQKD